MCAFRVLGDMGFRSVVPDCSFLLSLFCLGRGGGLGFRV